MNDEVQQAVEAPLTQLRKMTMQLASEAFDFDQVDVHMQKYLTALAVRLEDIYQQIEDSYAQILPVPGQVWDVQVPTPAQGLALARFLRPHFQMPDGSNRSAFVSRNGAGLGSNYLYIRMNDGYEGGIDKEGRVST